MDFDTCVYRCMDINDNYEACDSACDNACTNE